MRLIAFVFLCAATAWAGQSVILPAQVSGTVPFPALGTNPVRMEIRVHNRTPVHVPNQGHIIQLPGGTYIANAYTRDTALVCSSDISVAAYVSNLPKDFTVRLQRDPEKRLLSCEVWNTETGARIGGSTAVIQRVLPMPAGTATLGGRYSDSQIDFLKVYSTLLPLGSPAPQALNEHGDLLHYDFEGNAEDASGNSKHLIWAGPVPSFATAPSYPPSCHAGFGGSYRVGDAMPLDGKRSYAVDGSGHLSYTWRVASGPNSSIPFIYQPAEVTTSVTATAFGTYDFELTVRDQSGQSSTCTVKHGAVATDEHGVVILPDSTPQERQRNALLGPLIAFGKNPWPWADERHKAMADHFGAKLGAEWVDYWNTPLPGTISVTRGSPIVTGQGTAFKAEFCDGGSVPTRYFYLIIWYPLSSGGFGRSDHSIKSCDSDEQLTLTRSYTRSASASGLNYSNDRNRYWIWIGNETNANFYDNVLAYYSLYYRTGIDTYLKYAQTLADRWWTMPWMDEGRYCADGVGCLYPRNQALTGLTIRALERGDMWQGMRRLWDYYRPLIRQRSAIGDIRERGYELMFVAQCAIADPDPAHRAACAADVTTAVRQRWVTYQQPDKYWGWGQLYAGHSSWSDTFGVAGGGTITVENGSTRVLGTDTRWEADWFKNAWFWVCDTYEKGDPKAYRATVISPTELQLDRPYEGETASGKRWQSAVLVGFGTQPFMMGIAATGLHFAHLGSAVHEARQLANDSARWLKDYGYQPSTKGLYYARGFVNCEPIADGLTGCSYAADARSAQSARFLNGEVFNAFSQAYLDTLDPDLRNRADEMYAAVFGNPQYGGPLTDGNFVFGIHNEGYSMTHSKAKDFGFLFGMGFAASWPAARLADQSPVARRALKFAERAGSE